MMLSGHSTIRPGEKHLLMRLVVDRLCETATITNAGWKSVDLMGWVLVSTVGNQRYTFPDGFSLKSSASVVVTSGGNAKEDPPNNNLLVKAKYMARRW